MDKSSKIYVAGHSGLVGSAIVRGLMQRGFGNIITRELSELDLRDRSLVDAFLASERPQFVFLAAAKVGGIHANNTYRAEFIYDNLAIALNVIDASHKSRVEKLMNLGSSCIYPRLAPQPLREVCLLTGLLEPTNEPYAIAKIAAIKLCRYYNEQYGTDFLSVMPTNLYGPGDNFNLETSHVLPAMMRKFHLARLLETGELDEIRKDLSRQPLGSEVTLGVSASDTELKHVLTSYGICDGYVELWGTGAPHREFLHADDLAAAIIHLMTRFHYKDIGEFVNIGVGTDITIKALAERIRTLTRYSGKIRFDASKPDGTPRKVLDISKIKTLGWAPTISLDEGLQGLYEWYLRG